MKRGVIPEFIQIKEVFEVYTVLTEVNFRNKVLVQSQIDAEKAKRLERAQSGSPVKDSPSKFDRPISS